MIEKKGKNIVGICDNDDNSNELKKKLWELELQNENYNKMIEELREEMNKLIFKENNFMYLDEKDVKLVMN